ncbi:hypothetical protein EI983_09540 [Roseovarius faecimaris]|uniref:Glyoxalase-related protein domain-containing protein n=1 Tax=Roseovarius faecimaris TaxID=2494550 RepID=A0A6I6IN91_9RHOB|nr:glyoxalase superfamily protein [Roseovarius faecimaris]QGX98509.1 hypothetical protein EI983_09540 [Roseovarius faecimaris]
MTHQTLPPRAELKAQARRLRAAMADQGRPMTHATALETVAHQWGLRDWNTLSALAPDTAPPWQIGQRVTGRYLGQPFKGRIKSVAQTGDSHARLTLVFDQPVDVVTSDKFSSLRRQVTATVNSDGRTVEKTSDGQPHLVLHSA